MQEAMFTFTNGLYVIGAGTKPHYSGALVDALTQISANPPLVMLSMMNHSHTKENIDSTGEFSISVLPQDTNPFIVANFGFQGGKNVKKWEAVDYKEINGLPYLNSSLSKLKAKVIDTIKYPHNTLYVAEIIETHDVKKGEPLTYKYYREHLKPLCQALHNKNPSCDISTAPHEKGVTPLNIKKTWTCILCKYEYQGDIPFEDLPEDWRCPICGVGKEMFELI